MKDKAKAFAYICFGLMCLVLAGKALMSSSAHADINPAGSIHGLAPVCNGVLTTSGEVYQWSAGGMYRMPDLDPPIPLDAIAMWGGSCFVSTAGDLWAYPGGAWINFGPPPGGGVRTQESSWGEVKSKYGDN